MKTLLEVENLSAFYGKMEAIRTVSLTIKTGEIVTVIGPNGAGKTTLLNAVVGLIPSHGTIRFDGHSLIRMEIEDRVGQGLQLVPERRELFTEMSVADNLLLGAYRFRRDAPEVARLLQLVYNRFPRLAERRGQLASTLSGGERQMLAIGRALVGKPRLLMLDEPSLGLAPLLVREMFEIIVSLRELGVSILLVEQNARAALEAADRGYVLENGSIVLTGPASTLLNESRVEQAYLGSV